MEHTNDILTELSGISNFLASMPIVNVYTVPTNYFESTHVVILNAVQVPTGYFDMLASNIVAKINHIEQPQTAAQNTIPTALAALQQMNVFKVPNVYFSTLPTIIQQKISSPIEAPFSILKEAKKNNTLLTPEGYFENLPLQIIAKTNSNTAKIIQNNSFKNWYKYAAAAVFIGIVSFGVIKFSTSSTQQPILEASIEMGKNMDDKKFSDTINNLNEEDIAQYLAKTSTDADVASISTSIEENTVPAKDDYLLDEKTLENFLNDIEPIHSN